MRPTLRISSVAFVSRMLRKFVHVWNCGCRYEKIADQDQQHGQDADVLERRLLQPDRVAVEAEDVLARASPLRRLRRRRFDGVWSRSQAAAPTLLPPPALRNAIRSSVASSRESSPTIACSCITKMRSAQAEDLEHLGGDEHDRHPLLEQLRHQREHLGLGADVDPARRLVEQEHLRLVHEPAGDHDLLLVAAREAPDRRLDPGRPDAEPLEQMLARAALLAPPAREPERPCAHGDVLADAAGHVEALAVPLLGDEREPSLERILRGPG